MVWKLRTGPSPRKRTKPSRRLRPQLEPLEERILLTTIQFASSSLAVYESASVAEATVLVDPAATQAGEFYVQVTGGTAINGVDYTPHLGHFQIAPDDTSVLIELVHPIDDAIYLGNKTVTLQLIAVSGATVGTTSTIQVTLEDDETPPGPEEFSGPAVVTPDLLQAGHEQVRGDGYAVSLTSGTLTATHTLPSYQANVAPLQLTYSSATAAPHPVFLVHYTLDPEAAVPSQVGATLTFNGTTSQQFFFDTSGLDAGDTLQIALQGNAASLDTGRYDYEIAVTAYRSSSSTTTYNGQVSVLNEVDSALGAGWSLTGLQRLWEDDDGVLLDLGSGSSLWFAEGTEAGTFVTPAGDFSTLVENQDGTYTRTLKDGRTVEFASTGLLSAVVDRNGNTTAYTWSNSKLVTITDPNGLETEFTYATSSPFLLESITDPAGRVTAFTHHSSGLLTLITDPDPDGAGSQSAPETGFDYDSAGRLIEITDPRSYTTSFTYNFAGQVTDIIRADQTEESFVAVQRLGLVPNGSGTSQNPAAAVLALDAWASYTDPRGHDWLTRVDFLGFGLPVRQLDALQNATRIDRDADGLPTSVTDPIGRATSYEYDALGNATAVTLPDGIVYDYSYNSFSQLTAITEPDPDDEGELEAPVWQFVYDSNGNLIERIIPDDDTNEENNPRYQYDYDEHGWLLSVTDPRGFTTEYELDSRGQVVQITYPDDDSNEENNPTVLLEYDDAGNVESVTDERGYTTTFVYNDLNWLTELTRPDDDTNASNNPVESFAYDAAGNRTSATDALGNTTTWTFTAMNRAATMTGPDPDGAGSQEAAVTAWEYDLAGNLASIVNPVGRETLFEYNAANWLTQIEQGYAKVNFGYDGAGQRTSATGPAPDHENPNANRLATTTAYNPRGLPVDISDSLGRQKTFDYGKNGRLIGFT